MILMMAGIFISSCYGTQLHDKGTYAIVMKSRDNWYNELASQGYRSVIEDAGKNCLTLYPEEATAQ